ncbi:helix-turn-helix domain-containing protein [Ferrimonas balearica]|nr:helix-turn-helix domain-containing protein [Ferrimonas balearica]
MSRMERFSTSGVSPGRRLDFWNRICTETLAETCIDTRADRFDAVMRRWTVGPVTMVRPSAGPSSLLRAPFSEPQGEEGAVVLHFQHHGYSCFAQDGRRAELAPGDFVLSNAAEGYAFDFPSAHEFLVLQVPRAELARRIPALENRLCQALSGRTPAGQLLHDFLLSLWRNGEQGHVEDAWMEGAAQVVCDLVAQAVTGAEGAGPTDGAEEATAEARQDVMRLVEARLREPGLRTSDLAQAVGLSERTIQYLFARMSTTPSRYIMERRLVLARDLLRSEPTRPVTDIALELGFSDSSHFARQFRARFGMSPSQWRRA